MKDRPHHYVLVEREPVPIDDDELFVWADWFGNAANRIVKQEEVGPYMVSTVFLGLDHNFLMEGPPVLFETMVFCDGADCNYQERCCTWAEAEAQHEAAVAWAGSVLAHHA